LCQLSGTLLGRNIEFGGVGGIGQRVTVEQRGSSEFGFDIGPLRIGHLSDPSM